MVVGRCDVGGQRPQRVERGLLAQLLFQPHVLDDLVHRDVARAFDHHLHAMGFRDLGQLAQRAQLGELRGVVGVGDRAGPQPVAEGEGDVVLRQDVAQLVKVGVQERFLMMRQAPGGHDRAAAGHDAGHPLGGQRDVPQQHPGVHRHVVDALLALLDHGVAVDLPGQLGRVAVDLLQRLVDRHGADRHRGVAQDPLAGVVDVLAGGQVHDGVGAPAGGPHHLVDLLGDRGGDRRVADVGVDLDRERLADDHRLALGVVVVGRDHRAAAGDLVAHQLGGHLFAGGDERHLGGDLAGAGPLQLGAAVADHPGPGRQAGRQVDHRVGVGVGAGGVVEVEVFAVGQIDPAERHLGDSPAGDTSRSR